jgi:PAS domain-containing protein
VTAEAVPALSPNGRNGSRSTGTRPGSPQDGIVYIDADGRCTFINQAARTLLQWDDRNLALSDVLAGGAAESAELVEALKRQGLVEQHRTSLAAAASIPLELSAVALRDRDDNLWGAAVFIHKPAVASGPNGDSQS